MKNHPTYLTSFPLWGRWILALLFCLMPAEARAGLINSRGLWDFDDKLSSYWDCFPPVTAEGLVLGTDYSFASSGGYSYLQTQPFTPPTKRLTVVNNTGPNGWPGASLRTNRWSVVMDIRFDAISPYAGILQLDQANTGDVSFYVNGANGTLIGALGALSAANAIVVNTWYRIALTCGNDGAGGALTVKAYINGTLTGTRSSAFDGAYAMRPTFLMLSDNNGDLKPAKLNSLGLWGEELTAADISSLAGPRAIGLSWPGFSDENCPVLSAAPRAVLTGRNLNITFSTPTPSPQDRLALFLDGETLSAANVKRAIYIGGGATPTTAPSGGMPVISTSGLPAGRYWLHYLPGGTYYSAHQLAIRIDTSAPVITLSPASTYPGGVVTVSGAVEPGSPGARILLKEGRKEVPIYSSSVNPWGQFTIDGATIPADAPLGNTQVFVIPTGTTEPGKQAIPLTVNPVALATLNARVVRLPALGQVVIPLSGRTVYAYDADGVLAGTAITGADGRCSFPNKFPGTYALSTNEPGTDVIELTVARGQTTSAIADFRAPRLTIEPCEPSAELVNLEAITQSAGLFSGYPATSIGQRSAPIFAKFAKVGATAGRQEIEFAVTVRFDCANMDYFDQAGSRTGPGVRLTLPSAYAALPIYLINGTVVNGDDNLRRFTTIMDVASWPAGTPSLTIEAGYIFRWSNGTPAPFNMTIYAGASWAYPMQVSDLTPRWASGKATDIVINARPDNATNSINYSFSGLVPTTRVAWSQNIDLGLVKLENNITFGCPVTESFSTNGDFTAAATAKAGVKLLGFDVFNESLAFQRVPPSPDGLLGSTYVTPKRNIPLFDKCWPIPGLGIDARKCVKLCLVGCKVCVGISAGAFACIAGDVDVQGRIAADLRGGLTVTPKVTLSTPIRLQIDAVICGAGAEIKPQLQFALPVNLKFDPLAGGFGAGSVTLNAILNYYVRCFGITFFKGSKNLAEKTWNAPAFGPLPPTRSPRGGEEESIESPLISPAVATNEKCEAMAVWTGDTNMAGNDGPGDLYFKKGNVNGTWGETGLIPTGGSKAENPTVAWLDGTRALCVWTHPKFTPAAPPAGADPTFPKDLELRWSIYQGGVWSAPQFITNDDVWDIRPVLASDGAGKATCVWQRLNQPNPNIEPTVPMVLVAATFSAGTWSAPVRLAPASVSPDYQATVRYDAQGNPGVVWLRDPDIFGADEASVQDHTNQSLWYVHKAGAAAWTAPQQLTGLSPAAYSPSLDFDNAHQPCVVCLVPGVNKLESATALTGGAGNQSRIWFARRSSGTWGAAELRRHFGIFNLGMYGERPTLRISNGNTATVVFRRFGELAGAFPDAPIHYTGDIGIATAPLPASGTDAFWRADYITDDGQLNWQIAYDRPRNGFCGKMFSVKGAPDGSAAFPVFETIEDKTDPAILPGDFKVSNPHPIVGSSVTWTVAVTNRGVLNAGGGADPLRVEIRRDSPAGALVGSGTSTSVIALGEKAAITITANHPATSQQRYYAVVLPPALQSEITATNNTSELIVGGVAPPCNLVVSPAPRQGGTLLDWDPPAGTDNYRYRILRRTRQGPWEIVGYNLNDEFCDPSAVPGTSYDYAVVAEDPVSGVISDACAPGFVVIPALIPNNPGPMPQLDIARPFGTGPATLSWLDSDPLLYIERSTDMSSGSWSRMHNTTGKSGANRTLMVPLLREAEFFRLRRD